MNLLRIVSIISIFVMLAVPAALAQDGMTGDTEAAIPPASAAQTGLYNTEIAVQGVMRRYPQRSGDWTKQNEAGFSAIYNFNSLVHDNTHRSMASKAVIPTSWVGASLNYGPLYNNSDSPYLFRVFGAGLVSDNIGIGGGIIYHNSAADKHPVTNRAFAALVDIFTSTDVHLREVLAFGTIDADNISDSYSTIRFEHYLQLAATQLFSYSHELFYYTIGYGDSDTEYWKLTFNHIFEFSTSREFTIAPVIKTEGEFFANDEAFLLGGGIRFIVYPVPNVLIHFFPEYMLDPEEPTGGYYAGTLVVGVRF